MSEYARFGVPYFWLVDPTLSAFDYDRDYRYPTHAEVDYLVSKNLNLIRLPFRSKRLQPVLGADFDAAEQARLQDVVLYATQHGVRVLIDPHN